MDGVLEQRVEQYLIPDDVRTIVELGPCDVSQGVVISSERPIRLGGYLGRINTMPNVGLPGFFLPVRVLSSFFRACFLQRLADLFAQGRLKR